MAAIRSINIPVSLSLTLKPEFLSERLAFNPWQLSCRLAAAVSDCVDRQDLNYYPALDYFIQRKELDEDLVNATNSACWLAADLAIKIIQRHLRGIFSELRVLSATNAPNLYLIHI